LESVVPTPAPPTRRFSRRALAGAAALLTITSGLGALTGASASAATRAVAAPRCACPAPIAGESVTLTGSLTTRVARPLRLEQRTASGSWSLRASARSAASGSYRISTTVPTTRLSLRVVAPAVKISGCSSPAQSTPAVTVAPVAQTATASATAPVGQLADGTSALRIPVATTLYPARPGRSVTLQRWSGTGWNTVATGTEDASGKVLFLPAAGPAVRVRVAAPAAKGAPAVYSPALNLPSWGNGTFVDDFSGARLDESKWSYRQVGQRYGRRTQAHSAPQAVEVSRGALHLKTMRVTPTSPSMGYTDGYANGHIGSGGRFQFTYGIAAARIKFPPQRGRHGAFWLQSRSEVRPPVDNDPFRNGAEIDIVENYGAGRADGGSAHVVHWRGAGGKLASAGGILDTRWVLPAGKTYWNSWHVYSVEWTPSQYIFRIDGREVRRITQGVSGAPEEVVLSELSSDWELPLLDQSQLPTSVDVDWVRVWQT
jgi:beta-glucanase (GH16 family)